MGYTSVGKCTHIEIRTKFNLIHEKEWIGDTISNICKRYGVSRKTYYKWNNRYKQKGIEGLLDVSKRPHTRASARVGRQAISRARCAAGAGAGRGRSHAGDGLQGHSRAHEGAAAPASDAAFSATYPPAIEQISAGYQRDPVRVSVDNEMDAGQIEQLVYEVGIHAEDRIKAVLALLVAHKPESTLVFCNTKEECNTLTSALRRGGARAMALHGDLEQRERDEVLVVFANRSCSVLVATDVAARGLDIEGLDCVINYELSTDASMHLHRVGRTGRAGQRGLALSLYRADDSYRLQRIEQDLQRPLERRRLPSWPSTAAYRPAAWSHC